MRSTRARLSALCLVSAAAFGAAVTAAADNPPEGRSTLLNSPAMNAMLRADRDKDGVLSREELYQYDLVLGRRFREADADGDGRLTLQELETLFGSDQAPVGATR